MGCTRPNHKQMRRKRRLLGFYSDELGRTAMVAWIGGGCAICEESAAASPIAIGEDWPYAEPPLHDGCTCETVITYVDNGKDPDNPTDVLHPGVLADLPAPVAEAISVIKDTKDEVAKAKRLAKKAALAKLAATKDNK
jgi:hypothetical protein